MFASYQRQQESMRTPTFHAPRYLLTGNSLSGPIIKVIVGVNKTELYIHRSILTSSSEFFRNATKPEWQELRADPNTLILAEANVEEFSAYVHWLYFGTLPAEKSPTRGQILDDIDFPSLARAYVLGEELMDIAFKNSVLDSIVAVMEQFNWLPTGETVNIIFRGTPPGSGARRLVTEVCAHWAQNTDNWIKEFELYDKEFLLEALREMTSVRPKTGKQPWYVNRTQYHEKPRQ